MSLRRIFTALVWLVLAPSVAWAGTPSTVEWESARRAVSLQTGMELRWGRELWLVALRMRSPLVAIFRDGRCDIGISAWLPGLGTAAWFDGTPEAARGLWLEGMLRHEAAHCQRQAVAQGARSLTGRSESRREEAAADLAFAIRLADDAEHGPALLDRLIALRSQARGHDPAHDTAEVLRCFVRDRAAIDTHSVDGWLEHCAPAPQALVGVRGQ